MKRYVVGIIFFVGAVFPGEGVKEFRQERAAELTQKLSGHGSIYHLTTADMISLIGSEPVQIKKISAEELQSKLYTGFENFEKKVVLFNVLPSWLYDDCHITGSLSLPLSKLIEIAGSAVDWQLDQQIIVYCAIDDCDASEKAVILLNYLGYNDVCEYVDGIRGWYELAAKYGKDQYPIEGPCEEDYLTMDRENVKAIYNYRPVKVEKPEVVQRVEVVATPKKKGCSSCGKRRSNFNKK